MEKRIYEEGRQAEFAGAPLIVGHMNRRLYGLCPWKRVQLTHLKEVIIRMCCSPGCSYNRSGLRLSICGMVWRNRRIIIS